METIKLKIIDSKGNTLLTAPEAGEVSLVYAHSYQPGDKIVLNVEKPGQFCVVQFEDTIPPTLVCVKEREVIYAIPTGAQAVTYSPKSFSGCCHIVRARLAQTWELEQRRNLALNPFDQHESSGICPHASANVETRGEAVFAARNAVDGVYENSSHGVWPYQSWGINRDPNAAMTVDFGRPVCIDELRLTLRADYPHDSWWTSVTVEFSDGSQEVLSLQKSPLTQAFPITARTVTSLTLCKLIKADDPSPFPALTQLEAWGHDLT